MLKTETSISSLEPGDLIRVTQGHAGEQPIRLDFGSDGANFIYIDATQARDLFSQLHLMFRSHVSAS